MIYYMNLLIRWLRPYLSLLVDPYFRDGYVHTLDLIVLVLFMDGYAHTTYRVSEKSVVFVLTVFLTALFSLGRILINHFTPPSLLDLML